MRSVLALTVTLALIFMSASGAQEQPSSVSSNSSVNVPRYKLQVGQVLKYRGKQVYTRGEKKFEHDAEWTVRVIRTNADGSWRLVVNWGSGYPDGDLAFLDLHPDGHYDRNNSHYVLEPRWLFPKLPDNENDLTGGWKDSKPQQDKEYSFTSPRSHSKSKNWSFDAAIYSSQDRFFDTCANAHFLFEIEAGRLTYVEYNETYKTQVGLGETTTAKLVSIEQLDSEQTKHFAQEFETYWNASEIFRECRTKAIKAGKDSSLVHARAREVYRKIGENLTTEFLRKQITGELRHSTDTGTVRYYTRYAAQLKSVGKPAGDWTAKDLNGTQHSLRDYRGKIVVLDFWIRNCPPCMRGLPVIDELAKEFKDRPVAFLSMNSDEVGSDAKYVADKLGLKHTVLKAHAVAEQYSIPAYPTYVIIDKDGKIIEIPEDISGPNLRQELATRVQELLGRK